MATVALTSAAVAPIGGTTGFSTLRASLILTTSYVASSELPCGIFDCVLIDLDFTIGSLTSLEVKPQYTTDGGTTWHDFAYFAVPTAGVGVASPQVYQLTATGTMGFILDTRACESVRVLAKGTGTVTSSLLTVKAAGGRSYPIK